MKLVPRIIILLIALVAFPALAGAVAGVPIPGIYNSTDLGGALLMGHASTSRACLHTCGGTGDIFNVASWNGSALGTQWTVSCGYEGTNYTVSDGRVNGTGPVTYTSNFTGGSFWFGPGPWGTGTGVLANTLVITTVQFVNIGGVSTAVQSRANIQSAGTFENGCTLTFVIANGIGVGETDAATNNILPATYPPFLDTACAATRIYGTWGDVQQITLEIGCATPTNHSTWGAVKQLYR